MEFARKSGFHAATVVVGATVVGLALSLALVILPASSSHAFAGWSRIPHDEVLFGGTDDVSCMSVASTPSGFVAVGRDESVTAAAVWFSTDGYTWERAVHMEGMFGGPGSQAMWDVTAGPGNSVAVGYELTGSDHDAAVWTGGGTIWKRVAHDEAVFGGSGSQDMRAVAASATGVVAVGRDDSGGDSDAAVWFSEWGSNWTRVPHVEAVFGGNLNQRMWGVTAGGPGYVAVGDDGDVGAAAVWTSVDGITWSRVPHDEAVFGGPGNQIMRGVTAGGPGLVAVGGDYGGGDLDAAVWTSVDGVTWSRVPHDEAVFGGTVHQEMQDVTVGGPGLIAVGYDNDGSDRDAAVWTSVDGITWTREPHSETVFGGVETETMNGVATGSTGVVVAAGTQWAPYDTDAAVWTYTAPPPPPPPEPSPTDSGPLGPSPTTTSDVHPTATADPTPTPSLGPKPTPGPSSEPASSGKGGWGVGWYIGLGSVIALVLGGLGWLWLRRRP